MLSRVSRQAGTQIQRPVIFRTIQRNFADKDDNFFKAIFLQHTDNNPKGKIDFVGFSLVCNQFGITNPKEVFNKFDRDHGDSIDMQEFLKMCAWARDNHFN